MLRQGFRNTKRSCRFWRVASTFSRVPGSWGYHLLSFHSFSFQWFFVTPSTWRPLIQCPYLSYPLWQHLRTRQCSQLILKIWDFLVLLSLMRHGQVWKQHINDQVSGITSNFYETRVHASTPASLVNIEKLAKLEWNTNRIQWKHMKTMGNDCKKKASRFNTFSQISSGLRCWACKMPPQAPPECGKMWGVSTWMLRRSCCLSR